MSILVFIPMYNCSRQIQRVLAQFKDRRAQKWIDGIVCIDNRSTDGTATLAASGLETLLVPTRVLLLNNENYGLGGSHKVALEFAEAHGYEHLVVLHGDDQGSILDLIPQLEAGAHQQTDFLMGARFMSDSKLAGYSRLRTVANRFFNKLFSVISGERLYDLGSGLNLFRVACFEDRFHLRFADDLTFNYYLILAVTARKHVLQFFPLTWREDDQISNAKLGRMGFQIIGLLWSRISNKRNFLEGEHRIVKRDAYSSTEIGRWAT